MINVFLCVFVGKEQHRQDFATKANQAGAYIDAKNVALSELNMQGQGTLEEQLAVLKGFQDEVAGYQQIIEECESANQAAQAEMVFENPHTNYTMDVSQLLAAGTGVGVTMFLFF